MEAITTYDAHGFTRKVEVWARMTLRATLRRTRDWTYSVTHEATGERRVYADLPMASSVARGFGVNASLTFDEAEAIAS